MKQAHSSVRMPVGLREVTVFMVVLWEEGVEDSVRGLEVKR